MAQLVLIAGRDPGLRRRIVGAVAGPGRALLQAEGGAALVDLAGAEAPELLILDADSPEVGIAAVRAIHAQQRGVSILLLTEAHATERIAPLAASLGVHAVLARSGNLDVLADHVDRVLDERLSKLGLPFGLD